VLGMITGAAFSHNFGLASSPKGIGPYGIPAVIIGLAVCLFIGFTMRKKTILTTPAEQAKEAQSKAKGASL